MVLAFHAAIFGAVLLLRLRAEILRRERNASWLRAGLSTDERDFLAMGGYGAYVWPCFRAGRRRARR